MATPDISTSARLGDLADPARYHEPIALGEVPRECLRRMLERMILTRAAEERIGEAVVQKAVNCPCHLVIGQEAAAVGTLDHARKGDRVFGAHRSHAHYLALGGNLDQLLAEVQGKDTGCSRGMGGSMHLLDIANGLYGTVPIVGATIAIATGAGLAAQMDGQRAVSLSFFGDGATEEGVFHESLNFASVKRLPVIYVCENNLFSSHLHIDLRQPRDSICRFAEAHAIPWARVDGNDVVAVHQAAAASFARARDGDGPSLIEAVTYRWRGHVGPREDHDVGVRRKDDLEVWKGRDPIRRLAEAMIAAGWLTASELEVIHRESKGVVAASWKRAEQAAHPPAAALLDRVYYRRQP